MNKNNLILITITASLGGLLFGYDTGVINGTQFYFSKLFGLTGGLKGWVVASALVGCFVGSLFAGGISKRYGRKNSLILSAVLFTISAWGSGLPSFLPQSVDLLVFFRILGGIGIGIASMNAPTYIAELAPAHKRGQMVTYYQFAIVTGFLVVFIAVHFIGQGGSPEYNLQEGWRWMFWSELIPCFLFLFLLFFVPESPRWLIMSNRSEEAKVILQQLHGDEIADAEFNEITESVNASNVTGVISYSGVFKKAVLPIIVIGSVLSALQQFTGINSVLYYGADIFEKALGFGAEDVLEQNILLAGINFLATFIAYFTVDKFGRKPLIYLGATGMFVGFALLGGTLMFNQVGVISLIGILLFIGSFALSMGPIVWVLLAEMFPNYMRNVAMSIAVAAQWAANAFVTQMFPVVVDSEVNNGSMWSGSLPYFIFMAFIIVIVLFTKKYVPETKGKSLEELEAVWQKKYGK